MTKPQWKVPRFEPDPARGESRDLLDAMVAGNPYLAGDKFVSRIRDSTVPLLAEINAELDMTKRVELMSNLVEFRGGERNSGPYIVNPFLCEYGFNISIGDDVFIGPNCTMLDVCPIWIGDRTMIGANSQFYTPSHPIMPEERDGLRGAEWAKPITIGDDVWIGGGVVICPGVTIGNGSTVGAGAVVTKDVPERVVVGGNPARILKHLPPPGETVEGNHKPVVQT